jgi:hypothetical protein
MVAEQLQGTLYRLFRQPHLIPLPLSTATTISIHPLIPPTITLARSVLEVLPGQIILHKISPHIPRQIIRALVQQICPTTSVLLLLICKRLQLLLFISTISQRQISTTIPRTLTAIPRTLTTIPRTSITIPKVRRVTIPPPRLFRVHLSIPPIRQCFHLSRRRIRHTQSRISLSRRQRSCPQAICLRQT